MTSLPIGLAGGFFGGLVGLGGGVIMIRIIKCRSAVLYNKRS